jgi:hypothetical protein
MPPESDKVVALRRLLDERFPTAPRRVRRVLSTGVPQVDSLLRGGLITGTLTEFISVVPSGGNQLTISSILLATREARQRVALVDAAGTFDLEGFDDDALAHVVWVRCGSLSESWRAADLAARDPNYSVVVLDLRGFPLRQLMRTRDSIWVRLQRAAEQADTAIAVQTESAIVPNAGARILFAHALGDGSLMQPRAITLGTIPVELQRSRAVREAAS